MSELNYCNDALTFYGFGHCGFHEILDDLEKNATETVFSFDERPDDPRIPYGGGWGGSCKANLTYVVALNYLKSLKKEPLIPIFFAIDTSNNPYPLTPTALFSKDPALNKICTFSELRRTAKLCFDKRVDAKIREIALKSFVFVKVEKGILRLIKSFAAKFFDRYKLQNAVYQSSSFVFSKVQAPWENAEFFTAMSKREEHRKKEKPIPQWIAAINQLVFQEEKSFRFQLPYAHGSVP